MREASFSNSSEMQELQIAYVEQYVGLEEQYTGLVGTQGSIRDRQAVLMQAQHLRLLWASCKEFNRNKRLHAAGIVPVSWLLSRLPACIPWMQSAEL